MEEVESCWTLLTAGEPEGGVENMEDDPLPVLPKRHTHKHQ